MNELEKAIYGWLGENERPLTYLARHVGLSKWVTSEVLPSISCPV